MGSPSTEDLESENARLKKLLTEAMLDMEATQGGCEGKALSPLNWKTPEEAMAMELAAAGLAKRCT